ncbi:hypothetical protein JCM30566_03210 [Marinitoga arctica]
MKKFAFFILLLINVSIFSFNILDNYDFYILINNPQKLYINLYSNIPFFRYLYSKEGAGQESLYEYLAKNLNDDEIKEAQNFLSSNFLFISNNLFNIQDFFWINPVQDVIRFLKKFDGYIITDYRNQEKLINLIKNLFSYDVEYNNNNREYYIKNLNLNFYSIGGHIIFYREDISLEKMFKLLDDFNSLKSTIHDNIFISFKNQKLNYLLEPIQINQMSKYSDNTSGIIKGNYLNKEFVFNIQSSLKLISFSKFDSNYKIFGDSLIYLNINSFSELYNVIERVFSPKDEYSQKALELILKSIDFNNNIYFSEYFSRKGDGISVIIPGSVNLDFLEKKAKTWGTEKRTLGNYFYYSIFYNNIGTPLYLYVNKNQMVISSISPNLMKYLIVNSKKFSNLKIFNSNDLPKNILYIWYSNINSFFEEYIGDSVPGELLIINASENNKFIEKIILR